MTPLLHQVILERLATADVELMRRHCADLVRQGVPLARVVDDGLAPAMTRVGLLWERGAWTVDHEHAATLAAEAGIEAAAAVSPSPHMTNERTVLVSSVEGDWHSLPARMVAAVVADAGYGVRFLGAAQPPNGLRLHVERDRPDAVLLSCTLTSALPALFRTVRDLRLLEVPVYVGGRALGRDRRRADEIGADGWAADAAGACLLLAQDSLRHGIGDMSHRYHQYVRRRAVYPAWVYAAKIALGGTAGGPPLGDAELMHLVDSACVSHLVADPRVVADEARWLDRVVRVRGISDQAVTRTLRALADLEYVAVPDAEEERVAAYFEHALVMMDMHHDDQHLEVESSSVVRAKAGKSDSVADVPQRAVCRVFICDDQPDIRHALKEVIQGMPGFETVGEAADGEGLLEGLRINDVDVVILDVSMPHGGEGTARKVKAVKPGVKIVVFTAHRDDDIRTSMMDAGADEFVVKTGRVGPLREALRRVVPESGYE